MQNKKYEALCSVPAAKSAAISHSVLERAVIPAVVALTLYLRRCYVRA